MANDPETAVDAAMNALTDIEAPIATEARPEFWRGLMSEIRIRLETAEDEAEALYE